MAKTIKNETSTKKNFDKKTVLKRFIIIKLQGLQTPISLKCKTIIQNNLIGLGMKRLKAMK